jgi:hypothetical protein
MMSEPIPPHRRRRARCRGTSYPQASGTLAADARSPMTSRELQTSPLRPTTAGMPASARASCTQRLPCWLSHENGDVRRRNRLARRSSAPPASSSWIPAAIPLTITDCMSPFVDRVIVIGRPLSTRRAVDGRRLSRRGDPIASAAVTSSNGTPSIRNGAGDVGKRC